MSVPAILAPLFVQVALTFVLLFWLGTARTSSVQRGETQVRDVALGERNWPVRLQQLANSYNSQFELPVLFYVLTALALLTRKADLLFVLLAWVFVVSRLAHAVIHVTSNAVRQRFAAFLAGLVVLAVMWGIFAVRILSGI